MNGSANRPATCPHCREAAVQGHGAYRRKDGTRLKRYLCRTCGRTFSQATGTPTCRLRKRREWNEMVHLLTDYLSLRRMAARLNVSLSTAFRWRHRALALLARRPRPRLEGRVCVGYFFIRYSEKGSRVCNGPGSWGYFNWLRLGKLDPTRTDQRFRLLADGRPSILMVAQNEHGYQLVDLGQGRVTPERLAAGLRELVRPGSAVYAYDRRNFEVACRQGGFQFCDARRALTARFESRTDADHYWADLPAVPEYAYGWFHQFKGIATRYLEHYIVWYCDIVRKASRANRTHGMPPELELLRMSA